MKTRNGLKMSALKPSWRLQFLFVLSGWVFALAGSVGCIPYTAYRPTSASVPPMTEIQTRRAIKDSLRTSQLSPKKVQFNFSGMTATTEDGSAYSYDFTSMDLRVRGYVFIDIIIPLPLNQKSIGYYNSPLTWLELDGAKQFVDAAYVRKTQYTEAHESAAFAEFEEKAKGWQALSEKPPLPEEVQRCKVLAEDAFQKQEFEKAVDYYEDGLAIEPLWPNGQLNAALLCGELEMYTQAILHMKRYLALCPEVADAKKCRNQIWIWQEKIK